MKAFVLQGRGIECEQEMKRAFEATQAFESVQYLNVNELFEDVSLLNDMQKNDWVGIPGGFSYSDHFGSGRLLSLDFQAAGLWEAFEDRKVNVLGICNGFQILTEANVFGESVRLEHNLDQGFIDRWVFTQCADEVYKLPIRHGEGNLQYESLVAEAKVVLKYSDKRFDNGSKERGAGLSVRKGESLWVGMMPHPEIALKRFDDPDRFGADHFVQHRERLENEEGDGLKLLKQIVQRQGEFE